MNSDAANEAKREKLEGEFSPLDFMQHEIRFPLSVGFSRTFVLLPRLPRAKLLHYLFGKVKVFLVKLCPRMINGNPSWIFATSVAFTFE
jgi:hypothetical protein